MAELTRLRAFALRIKRQRRMRVMSLRAVEAEVGISFNTLARIERGSAPCLLHFAILCEWLGCDARIYLRTTRRGP